jgi:general secretion pathway protein I
MTLRHNRSHSQAGFTLIEVMVALAIFSLTAVALMRSAIGYMNAVEGLETRTLAHFVAMNEAANITVTQAWLEGTAERRVEEQGRDWQIATKASPVVNTADVRRVEIKVAPINPQTDKARDAVTVLVVFIKNSGA